MSRRNRVAGYWEDMRQPGVRRNFQVSLLRGLDLDRLDQWLGSVFDIFVQPARFGPGVDMDGEDTRLAVESFHRASYLANALFWRMKFPSFGRCFFERVDLDAAAGKASIQLIVPFHAVIPEPLFVRCYGVAWSAIDAFHAAGSSVDLEALSDEFEASLIQPAASAMGGGASTVTLLSAAYQRGVPFRHVTGSVYQLGQGARARWLDRSGIDGDSDLGVRLSQNKAYAAEVLRAAGLPVPRHLPANDEETALAAAEAIGYPLVVKPADRDLGVGVTVDVRTPEQLSAAFRKASEASPRVLVEELIAGVCHRLLVVNGKVLYANARWPVHVIGDGERTIRQLAEAFNRNERRKIRYLRTKPLPEGEEADAYLRTIGFSPDDVPAAGVRVCLRPTESAEWGGIGENVTERMHPENAALAIRAARQMRLSVAGIDLMTTDISVPWHASGARINEVNPFPLIGIRLAHNRQAALDYIDEYFPDGGRVEIVFVLGGAEAYRRAIAAQRADRSRNIASLVCASAGHREPGAISPDRLRAGIFGRVGDMLTRVELERLYVVVQTDEFLHTGLPVDRIDSVEVTDDDIRSFSDPAVRVDRNRIDEMLRLIGLRCASKAGPAASGAQAASLPAEP